MDNKDVRIPILDYLLVLFVGLKLTHHIDWSWGWVLWPVWVGIGIGLLIGAANANK